MGSIDLNKIVGSQAVINQIDSNLIWEKFNRHAATLLGVDQEGKPNFKFTKSNKKIIRTILRYFAGRNDFNEFGVISGNADLSKGLLISGDLGVGKSLILEIIQKSGREIFSETGNNRMHFLNISCGNFVQGYMFSSKHDHLSYNLEKYYKGRYHIEDLGNEPLAFNNYELMESVLFERHRNRSTTFVTTNLSPYEIAERYGSRIGDRLNEMFNIIIWSGDSFRDDL